MIVTITNYDELPVEDKQSILMMPFNDTDSVMFYFAEGGMVKVAKLYEYLIGTVYGSNNSSPDVRRHTLWYNNSPSAKNNFSSVLYRR